jgi:hypothetical protein
LATVGTDWVTRTGIDFGAGTALPSIALLCSALHCSAHYGWMDACYLTWALPVEAPAVPSVEPSTHWLLYNFFLFSLSSFFSLSHLHPLPFILKGKQLIHQPT